MSEQTKPLHAPSTDAEWLRRKIEFWERAEVQAEIRLAEIRNQLRYFRTWQADIEGRAVIDTAAHTYAIARAAAQLAAVEARIERGGLPTGEYHQLVGQAEALLLVLRWGGVWGGDSVEGSGGGVEVHPTADPTTHPTTGIIQGGNYR